MKNAKKILAIALVALMMLSTLSFMVSADTPTSGTVTISNAMAETTYTLYRAFDATYTSTTDDHNQPVTYISYTLDASTEDGAALLALIQAAEDEDGYDDDDQVIDGGVCSFVAKQVGTSDIYEITQKENFPEAAGRGWLKEHLDLLTQVDSIECALDSETVVFDENVTPGYYLVTATNKGATSAGSVVTVTSAAPNATVIDKNSRTPSDVEKTAEQFSAEIGEEVPFTVSFKATNFRTNELGDTNRVVNYILTDTIVKGLDFLSETDNTVFGDAEGTIKLYRTKGSDGTFSDEIKFTGDTTAAAGETLYTPIEYTYDATTNELNIVWGDEVTTGGVTTSTSRYPTNVYVVIEYKMAVNDETYAAYNGGYKIYDATNKIEADMKLSEVTALETIGEDDATVKTAGISIRKLDANSANKQLSGAKFILYKDVTEDSTTTRYYWTWDSTENKVVWVTDEDDAQESTADNATGTAEFWGLKEGTYYIKETQAPDGYTLPSSDYTLVISKTTDATTQKEVLTAKVNNVAVTVNANGIFTTIITNSSGSKLPSTGGVGTTLFYIFGGLIFAGAVVAIITKKRMAND